MDTKVPRMVTVRRKEEGGRLRGAPGDWRTQWTGLKQFLYLVDCAGHLSLNASTELGVPDGEPSVSKVSRAEGAVTQDQLLKQILGRSSAGMRRRSRAAKLKQQSPRQTYAAQIGLYHSVRASR